MLPFRIISFGGVLGRFISNGYEHINRQHQFPDAYIQISNQSAQTPPPAGIKYVPFTACAIIFRMYRASAASAALSPHSHSCFNQCLTAWTTYGVIIVLRPHPIDSTSDRANFVLVLVGTQKPGGLETAWLAECTEPTTRDVPRSGARITNYNCSSLSRPRASTLRNALDVA